MVVPCRAKAVPDSSGLRGPWRFRPLVRQRPGRLVWERPAESAAAGSRRSASVREMDAGRQVRNKRTSYAWEAPFGSDGDRRLPVAAGSCLDGAGPAPS